MEVPREPGDRRYALSFDAGSAAGRAAAAAFYEEWGFVVFREVLSAAACAATEAEIWTQLEARTPGLLRDEPATHDLLPAKRYGLPDEQAVFTSQVRRARPRPFPLVFVFYHLFSAEARDC